MGTNPYAVVVLSIGLLYGLQKYIEFRRAVDSIGYVSPQYGREPDFPAGLGGTCHTQLLTVYVHRNLPGYRTLFRGASLIGSLYVYLG
jgi:hypothetical protein